MEANIDKLLLATLPDQTVNQKSVTDHLDHLLAGIHSSTSPIPASDPAPLDLLSASPKNLLFYIKGLKNEKTLVKVYELFYYNNALTPKIMMDIILNKHLVNLSKIPMIDQISNYLTSPSSQNRLAIKLGVINDWNKFDFVQLNIILLKKYHDLKKPLLIIRNLKAYFESTYYPLIEMASDNTLSPFYERIVWKFYFEYLLNDEQYYIQRLNRLSSTVIIWESSLPNKSMEIMENALSFHKQDLNHPLQMSFFKLCSSQMTNTLVREELGKASHKSVSPTLSMLKQLSIKYKPYTFTKMSTTSDSRSILYQFIQDMESIILDEFLTNKQTTTGVESESILELMELYKDIIKFKETELMKIQRDEKDDVHDWVAAGSHTFALDK